MTIRVSIRRLLPAFMFMIAAQQLSFGQSPVVTLDYYFNHESKKNKEGVVERYHYIWEDKAVSGYSQWGDIFRQQGFLLKSLEQAPTKDRLKGTSVYIIVDPDTQKETPSPHYIEQKDIVAVSQWVKQGGILLLMANDSANVELPHLNQLAAVFGIRFTDTLGNHVTKNIETGKTIVGDNNPIFKAGRQLYLKDVATLALDEHAIPLVKNGNDIIMAAAHYGKGLVFAVGDPWIYNEYITNEHLSPEYQNNEAAAELVQWLVKQLPLTVSKKQVDKWVTGKEWSNGITQVPHASVDKEMFYRQYHLNKEVWDKAFRFMKENDLSALKPGKYPIDGEHVFASVTESPNKEFDATKWESHRRYIDFQYIISGKEKIGVADAATAKVIKPYAPDVMNYETTGKFYIATPGKFFLFFPGDAHRPNIRVDGVDSVKKLVIKIEMAD